MEKINLVKILKGDIACIDIVNIHASDLPESEIIVKPEHVRKMLLDFIVGKYTAKELTKWASFICGGYGYCCENYLDDETADYYEDMFYVIQKLSTPQLDGEVNEEQVRLYLSELEKYF